MRLANRILRYAVRRLKPLRAARRLVTEGFRLWYDLPVAPTHYYSPLPDLAGVKSRLGRWYYPSTMAGIDLAAPEQLALLRELERFRAECDGLPAFGRLAAEGYGPGYGEVEAHLLHC